MTFFKSKSQVEKKCHLEIYFTPLHCVDKLTSLMRLHPLLLSLTYFNGGDFRSTACAARLCGIDALGDNGGQRGSDVVVAHSVIKPPLARPPTRVSESRSRWSCM